MTRPILVAILISAAAACADNLTPAGTSDGGSEGFTCLPDLDGRITAAEMPVILDNPVDYYISGDGTTVDLAGQTDASGRRFWDFSAERASDARVAISAAPLAEQWYADEFPAGEFVMATALAAGAATDGIYALDDEALWFLGAASRDEEPTSGTTLLVYRTPIALFRFPLVAGDAWTESGVLDNAELNGLPYNGTDSYQIEVDGNGRLDLPYLSFEQALRVRTRVVVTPAVGGVTTSKRQVSFLFECFGEVARATSRADEAAADFTTAAELRRFAL